MNEDNTQQGNSAIGMQSDSFDAIAGVDSQEDNFFEALERDVNGVIADDVAEETPQMDPNMLQNQNAVSSDARSNGVQGELEQVKKRYSDSSREAQKMKAQLDELQPFIPVLNAMKQDSGLVDHMKTYLENGGNVIGHWPREDYDFVESKALMNDELLYGLAIDEDNEDDLTHYRFQQWVEQLKKEIAELFPNYQEA